MVIVAEPKQVVAPGELLAEGDHLLGDNSFKVGTKIFSACIGIVEVGLSGWTVDIRAPYEAMLPASETPGPRGPRRRDLSESFDVGDMVLSQVLAFDRTRDPLLTVKGPGLGKISNGRVVEISAAKIPRLIGRKGSMISMLKRETGCQITVGQNGVVMVWGKTPDAETLAVEAIYMVEREAHTRGLTDRIREMIAKNSVVGEVAGA